MTDNLACQTRRTLETERSAREQADKQVLDLLRNVKNRYEVKMNGYKAGNANKKDKVDQKDKSNHKEKSGTKNSSTAASTSDDANQKKSSNWGDPVANSNWGDITETNQEETTGWADSGTNSGWNNEAENNQEESADWGGPETNSGWNNEADTNQNESSGWGQASEPEKQDNTKDKENSGKKGKPDKNNKGNQKGKSNQKEKSGSNEPTTPNKSTENNQKKSSGWGESETNSGWNDPAPTNLEESSGWGQPSEADKQDNSKDKENSDKKGKVDKNNKGNQKEKSSPIETPVASTSTETKNEVQEIKSQLWSAKLDLRLMERDKNRIAEERDGLLKQLEELTNRNEKLERELSQSKKMVATLKEGCALVEGQAKTFEYRHDTAVMSKADLERELIAIKEESSRHITTINNLQKSNEQISKAFLQSVASHDELKAEFARRLDDYRVENIRLVESNDQLRKCIDFLQKKL